MEVVFNIFMEFFDNFLCKISLGETVGTDVFLNMFLTSCPSFDKLAELLKDPSEPLVYTPRPEVVGLNPSLSRVDEAPGSIFLP